MPGCLILLNNQNNWTGGGPKELLEAFNFDVKSCKKALMADSEFRLKKYLMVFRVWIL